MDGESGQVLVENNGDQCLLLVSLIKLMIVYIVIKEIEVGCIGENDLVIVSEYVWCIGGLWMFIKVGSQVLVSDLLYGIIIQFGNDVSVVLVEYIVGSEDVFVDMMNIIVQKLGLINFYFMDVIGLFNLDYYFFVCDMVVLVCVIIYGELSYYVIYVQKEFFWNNIKQLNCNLLLWCDKIVDGLKIGYIDEVGYCLVVFVVCDGQCMIVVVFGINSEQVCVVEIQKLLIYGFCFFESCNFYKKGIELIKGLVWKGFEYEVKVGFVEDLIMILLCGQMQKLQVSMVLEL